MAKNFATGICTRLTPCRTRQIIPLPGATIITSYSALKLMPFWDPLRGDLRFEKIVQSLAPKQ